MKERVVRVPERFCGNCGERELFSRKICRWCETDLPPITKTVRRNSTPFKGVLELKAPKDSTEKLNIENTGDTFKERTHVFLKVLAHRANNLRDFNK